MKKVHVEGKQSLKEYRLTSKSKKRKAHKIGTRATERFGHGRKNKGQDETDTSNKKQSRRCSSDEVGFFKTNLNKIANLEETFFKEKKKEVRER